MTSVLEWEPETLHDATNRLDGALAKRWDFVDLTGASIVENPCGSRTHVFDLDESRVRVGVHRAKTESVDDLLHVLVGPGPNNEMESMREILEFSGDLVSIWFGPEREWAAAFCDRTILHLFTDLKHPKRKIHVAGVR